MLTCMQITVHLVALLVRPKVCFSSLKATKYFVYHFCHQKSCWNVDVKLFIVVIDFALVILAALSKVPWPTKDWLWFKLLLFAFSKAYRPFHTDCDCTFVLFGMSLEVIFSYTHWPCISSVLYHIPYVRKAWCDTLGTNI